MLKFDSQTGKISYREKEIGEHIVEDGRVIVRLEFEFKDNEESAVLLSWLSNFLSKLPENQPPPTLLTIETDADSIDEEFDVDRYLTEKYVKAGGYVWDFHKTDVDPWPSALHGHDYDKGLKLCAISGDIYDVSSRKHCKTLKTRDLEAVQAALRASKDFKEAVAALIDNTRT